MRIPFTFSDGQQRAMFATAHNPAAPGIADLCNPKSGPGSKLGGIGNVTIDMGGLNS